MDFEHGSDRAPPPPFVESCPFCPGNEAMLPGVLWERSAPGSPGWACRAVPNLYPAFSGAEPDRPPSRPERGRTQEESRGVPEVPLTVPAPARPALGWQEVLIETPRHDRDPSTFDASELRILVDAWVGRLGALTEANPQGRVFLFRNHGREAGASLAHPHTQIVSVAMAPPDVESREARMARFHRDTGRWLLQALAVRAWAEDLGVLENDGFRAFVPWAAECPLEIWIVPREPGGHPGQLSPTGRDDLADSLGRLARALRRGAGDPPYNLMVHAPAGHPGAADGRGWFIQIRPRTSRLAGFELASGVAINTSSPERDAAHLRELASRPFRPSQGALP